MKRIILTALLIVSVCVTSFARRLVAEGKTYSALGDYKIQVDDKLMTINGIEHLPFVITYANSDMEVRVAIDMEKKEKKYYVLSDNLSVQYVSNKDYFGVEELDEAFVKDGFKTSGDALNRIEYFHQQIITSGQSWKRDNTPLIAAFFPMLLNNVESMIASR
jgi:hypothetical protein